MLKTITINPKEVGSTIKIGKLPVFTRSLATMADLSNVVQIVVEGRYYAVELRKPKRVTSEPTIQKSETVLPTKKERTESKKGKKLSGDLKELGFYEYEYGARANSSTPRKNDFNGRPIARGDLPLHEWLKTQDYAVYALFLDRNSGRALVEKTVSYDDFVKVFVEAGFPNVPRQTRNKKGCTAQRMANIAVSQLLLYKIIQKEEGFRQYSLAIVNGGRYARGVFATVKAGEYVWAKGQRRLQGS